MQSNSFGRVLNYLRESNFISKTKLAKEINVSRQLLATLESGHSVPNAEHLFALANFFNVTVDYLLGRDSIANDKRTHIVIPDELTGEERKLIEDYAYFILNRREKKC
jgi:transcriptional regulator with XRE-family HTH domain